MSCLCCETLRAKEVSLLYETECHFTVDDVEDWMWDRAASRPGYWTITIPLQTGRKRCLTGREEVVHRTVNFSQKEYTLLDKVVTNQMYSESKVKVHRTVVYQRLLQLWDTGSDDHVAMRTLGAWAISYYKGQPNKFYNSEGLCGWLFGMEQKNRAHLTKTSALVTTSPNNSPNTRFFDISEGDDGDAPEDEERAPLLGSPPTQCSMGESHPPARNQLGYQNAGVDYVNQHPGGGNDSDDSQIRAATVGRIVRKQCGIGVVGQSTDDMGRKQICGVLSQPTSVEPNIYAQELQNAIKAIEERINKKQRPYAGSKDDELKIKRMVYQSIHGKRDAPFSSKKVLDLLHTLVYENIKSNKWTEARVADAIEGLCREIDPEFKLKAAVKLEPMPEGKAPRLLIADEDRGQVMALMTIYCMETLIKKHFPEKGIKGLSKKDAIKRVMKACRVPRKQAKKMVTIFEGDGSAWDTTCSASIRALVENPVINHIANLVNGFMYATPQTWAEAHSTICAKEKLDISYSKNKEYQKITIDAIRRSGHRGTSCLNWWVNFVCWHCAIFEDPEAFLDPAHRYGKDVLGENRWMNSAFEGDDSFLVTSPKIEEGKSLHMTILQFWERIGFNMKIEIRKERALFVGYYIGLDEAGPLFNEGKDEWMMLPEVDRCFSRAGTSCSPSMIEAFQADDRKKCVKLAGAAAMSRAYEFAGLVPTISTKFLAYAEECDFDITHDLKMRTNQEFDDKGELVEHIRCLNATCKSEDEILRSTGFWCSDEERGRFVDYMWNYDQLVEWKDFRESLPVTWRQ